MEEAQDLINDLGLLLLRENELLEEIKKLREAKEVTQIIIGGGGFK
jgi:hypothetical protein